MKIKILFVLSLLISENVFADDINWYRVSANALITLDWLQTREIARSDEFHEKNKLLGRYPSQSDVNKYFIGSLLINNLIGEFVVPKDKRNNFYLILATVNFGIVYRNFSAGVRIQF